MKLLRVYAFTVGAVVAQCLGGSGCGGDTSGSNAVGIEGGADAVTFDGASIPDAASDAETAAPDAGAGD
ncbi:MAG TPA: hypothetical protein VE987_12385 [Polyangiaceae bacterium]|nr:hypothetical protein [Polyangiaceae bacterium]